MTLASMVGIKRMQTCTGLVPGQHGGERYGEGTCTTVRWYGQNGTGTVPGRHRLVRGCKGNMGAKRYGGGRGKTVRGR